MSTWEQFEIDCTRFLMEQFGEYATFIHQGRSDSTVPDIKVTTKKNKQFYIEAAIKILMALTEKFCNWDDNEDSVLQMGTEAYTRGIHPA